MELLDIFNKNGYEAYVVGGFVRDIILGRESYDVDITTSATPKQIQEIFGNINLPFESYGSVKLNYKNAHFEITTYRVEFDYKDKRKPSKIIYTDKLIEDLKRRDFTINTLCMDKNGKIIDTLGVLDDIKNKVIKTVGDADKKIKEDALRILRAIRFATDLDFELDTDLKCAIISNKSSLKELSYFRKKQELNRIFSSNNFYKGIKLLNELELSSYLQIQIDKVVKTSDPIGVWAQVNPSSKYPFTSNERNYLEAILRVLKDGKISDFELYKEGNYVCYIACEILGIKDANVHNRYDNLPITKRSDILINGKDIIDTLLLDDKKKVKQILNDIEQKIVLKDLKNEREELLKYVIDTYSK